jgi:ankyrin repeat protein
MTNFSSPFNLFELTWASFIGRIDIVKYHVDHNCDINHKDKHGHTALMNASRNVIEIVKYLVQHNALINEKDNQGKTALIHASDGTYFEIVKYLVQHNALINEKDNDGWTALMWASRRDDHNEGCHETIKYLIQHNAIIDEEDNDGLTAILIAYTRGNFDTVIFLIKKGAKIYLKGQTSMSNSLLYNYSEVRRIVMKRLKMK